MKVLFFVVFAAIVCGISARSVGDKTEKGAFTIPTNFHPKRMTQETELGVGAKKLSNWFAPSDA